MEPVYLVLIPLLGGYLLDFFLGDPSNRWHPVAAFGNLISAGEKRWNNGNRRFWKGLAFSLSLIAGTFFFFHLIMHGARQIYGLFYLAVATFFVFIGLANRTLICEAMAVIKVLEENGLEAGRKRLSYIVGRDTSALTPQQIYTAVLETLSENLSDGVIAPVFWYGVAGIPGMMTYKMVNTLDSMIGYKNERYLQFGCFAARFDDLANWIPARLTACLMVVVMGSFRRIRFIQKYARAHSSPNAGYPEAALAGILNCRFGGPNFYFGKLVEKPYIGSNDRELGFSDLKKAVLVNEWTSFVMVGLTGWMLWIWG